MYLTDRDTHTVMMLDSSTGKVTPISGVGVAPANAVGAIYDTGRKREGGGEAGALRAGAGAGGGTPDWMVEVGPRRFCPPRHRNACFALVS
jgi:hypothetical protein